VSTYRDYEPEPVPESDLSQIEAYDRRLTSDPGCWTQPVEPRVPEPEVEFDTEEADRYEAWVDGPYEDHCRGTRARPGHRRAAALCRSRLAGGLGTGPRGGRVSDMGQRRAWLRPVYDVHPSDQAIRAAVDRIRETSPQPQQGESPAAYSAMEFDRDLMIKDGWPRGAAEQMALQHARQLALNEVQAGLEAG